MGKMNAIAGSGDYSTGGNFLPRVDCSLVVQLVDLRYKEKAGKKQQPAYFAKVIVLESDHEKVVDERKYDLMLSLAGAHDSGIKRLVSFLAAFAGVEGASFDAESLADENGKGKWVKLASDGKLEEQGLIAALVRTVDKYKVAVLDKNGQPVAEERDGTNDRFFPFKQDE